MPPPPLQSTTLGPTAPPHPILRSGWRPQRIVLAAAAILGVLALAVWQIPPMLEWSRYKAAIASYASARLGRHITIGGQVSLTLLPRATLVANDVALGDRGDGISAKLGTMRLEVSLRALLAGHVVPRALMLDSPTANLPWPIPRAAPSLRPSVPREFTASMHGGTLQIGGVTITDIAAVFQTDPDTGAFNAYGSAMVAALPWRFTAQLSAPGADGISPLVLTLDGQAPYAREGRTTAPPGTAPLDIPPPDMRGTGGAFRGRVLPDGSVAGALTLRGPNLSRLASAPAVPWSINGDLHGDSAAVTARSLHLQLGSAAGTATGELHLGSPLTLAIHASFGQISLGDWAWTLLQSASPLATQLDLAADAALFDGEQIRSPHLIVSLGSKAGPIVESLSATLPGEARLAITGVAAREGRLAGTMRIAAPDLRHTLHWLTGGRTDALPLQVLRKASIQGTLAVNGVEASLSSLTGTIDQSTVAGGIALSLARRPALGIDLTLDHLSAANWLPWPALVSATSLGALATPFAGLDAALRLHIGVLALQTGVHAPETGQTPAAAQDFSGGPLLTGDRTLILNSALIDAEGGQSGLTLHHLTADAAGGHLEVSGTVGPDGTLAAAQADFAAADAASLPAAWRTPATLWHGPLHVTLSGAGAPQDTTALLRADLGDLRAEAEAHLDRTLRQMTATVTLRHPGAPRLLEEAGIPGTEVLARAWVVCGSGASHRLAKSPAGARFLHRRRLPARRWRAGRQFRRRHPRYNRRAKRPGPGDTRSALRHGRRPSRHRPQWGCHP